MGEGDNLTNSQVESIKNPSDGRSDPDKQFPKKEYVYLIDLGFFTSKTFL